MPATHAINAGGLSAETLAETPQPLHAALYDLAMIGEALNKVSSELKAPLPACHGRRWVACGTLSSMPIGDLELIEGIIESRIDPLLQELDDLIAMIERAER